MQLHQSPFKKQEINSKITARAGNYHAPLFQASKKEEWV
jgi:hypothetical protein